MALQGTLRVVVVIHRDTKLRGEGNEVGLFIGG